VAGFKDETHNLLEGLVECDRSQQGYADFAD